MPGQHSVIHQLDEITINKIAAGEVIDRPVSVVKELIENSLDAHATQVRVHLEQGGLKRIQVTDNGVGISKIDLPLAIVRHATSKIKSLEDIYETHHLGFRGEALSSMCHAGELIISSRQEDLEVGYQLTCHEDTVSSITPIAHPVGTTVTLKTLFSAIPVRRKFLKSPGAELSKIIQLIQAFSLLWPKIDFILESDQQERLNTTGMTDPCVLAHQFFGKAVHHKIRFIEGMYQGVSLKAWVSDPTLSFPNRNKQYLCINQRMVKSPIIQKIISQVFRDLIPAGRFPLFILQITLDPSSLDVNVHPKKAEVQFLNPEILFKTVPTLLKRGLSQRHDFRLPETQASSPKTTLNQETDSKGISSHYERLEFSTPSFTAQILKNKRPVHSEEVRYFNHEKNMVSSSPEPNKITQKSSRSSLYSIMETMPPSTPKNSLEFLHLFDTYLVIKAGGHLWILDQHAVHERILYEKLKVLDAEKKHLTQDLLLAEVVSIDAAEAVLFESYQDALKVLGFHIDTFGPGQLKISKVPYLFSKINLQDWLKNLLTDIKSPESIEVPSRKEFLEMKACKAAIKAGKSMAESEVKALIEQFIECPSNFTCPHGRPLFIRYSKADLEKLFLRR